MQICRGPHCAAAGGIISALLLAPSAAQADPLPTRDQNPLLSGFGIPMPLPARLPARGQWTYAADLNWGSTALIQAEGIEELIVDAETRELRLTLARSLSDSLALRVEVPYRQTTAGNLDGFIDSFHNFFGLPEGSRNDLPRDELRIAYARGVQVEFDIDDPSAGLADMSLAFGYQAISTPSSAVSAWAELKVPTGNSDELTGSGAADASIALAAEHRFHDRWSIFGQGAVTWLGQGDRFDNRQRSTAWSAVAGLGWRVWRGLELKVQLDGHTALLRDTRLNFFSDALALTGGGSYRFASGWELQVAISEDIAVNTVPDVVFIVSIGRQAR